METTATISTLSPRISSSFNFEYTDIRGRYSSNDHRSTASMINYYSCNNSILNHQIIHQLIIQLKTSNVENFRDFLKLFPPVKQLIRMIPSTLPLLDIIITKSLKFHKTNSSKGALHYNELFNNLLWWIAYNEQKNVPQVRISKVEITRVTQSRSNLSSTTYEDWEKHIRSILAAIKIDSPSILEAARDVELCLADSLEALGCHGLINCSEGLIRLLDAICLEVSNHQKRLKQVAKQLRNLKIDKSEFEASSAASHHRHVNLHLSQVYLRISNNNRIKNFLIESLINPNLSSLLRIVCRRVICDQTLIKLYKVLVNSAPSDYAISETDPIVADVIATFNMAYHRLLSLSSMNHYQFNECPNSNKYISETSHEEDLAQYRLLLSTSDTDTETDPSCSDLASSNSQIAIASSFGKGIQRNNRKRSGRMKKGYSTKIHPRNNSTSTGNNGVSRHHSLIDLRYSSCSCNNRCIARSGMRSARSMNSLKHNDSTAQSHHHYQMLVDQCSLAKDDAKIERLYSECYETKSQVQLMAEQENERAIDRFSKKEHSFGVAKNKDKNSCRATCEETLELVKKFRNLYYKDGKEILKILEGLPEFRGSKDLQHKILMLTVVLSYRSVQQNVERRRRMIFKILGDLPSENEESENLEDAIYKYMSRKAVDDHGKNSITKQIMSQIRNALCNFPSLRSCTFFNKFILDCVTTTWSLVVGLNGKPPRMYIEYQGRRFDANRHQRHIVSSNIRSSTVRQYLWPAIVDKSTGTCVHKAVVIT